MKITLISPPLFGEALRWDKSATYPPLGLCYIAAVLEKNGHEVRIIDGEALGLSREELGRTIRQQHPDLVGVTSITPKYKMMLETIKIAKEVAADAPIVVGGPHVSLLPQKTMEEIPEIDFVVRSEAEYTVLELVDALENGKPFSDIRGLLYRSDGEIKINPPREFIENLDELPFPARHLLPDPDVYKSAFRYKKLPMTTMITSRGCPFNCLFCDRVFGKKYRTHSPSYVVAEIEHLVSKYGIREIHFVDDLFLLSPERTKEICKLIEERGMDISWSCNGRINVLHKYKELIPIIKKAGCWYISFGLESGNQKVLDFIRKKITLEQTRDVIKWVHDAGIMTRGFFMIGHPVDTKETIRDTINFAKSLPLDGVQFSVTLPYPGTELYDVAIQHGTFDQDAYDRMSSMTPGDPVYVPEGLTKEYLKNIQRQAYREFYFRPSYMRRQLKNIKDIASLKKYSERGFTFFKATVLNRA